MDKTAGIRWWTTSVALVLLAAAPVGAVVWTVDDDGPADFASIQAAINASSGGDEIVVAAGRYRETLSFLGKAITVRSEHGPERTTVFLEGETRIAQIDGDATLEGFTITGGSARVGGGIRVTGGASVRIEGNIIENNVADRGGTALGLGGGIAIELDSTAVITRNVIRNNEAIGDAQGLYAYGGAIDIGDDCTATITENIIVGNTATDSGGAISIGLAGLTVPIEVAHNTIVGNGAGVAGATASFGGGMLSDADAEFAFRNNLVIDNAAETSGGGVYFFSGGLQGITYLANDFSGNTPDDCDGLTGPRCDANQFFLAPLFFDAGAGDYRPRSDSPTLDLGAAGGSSTVDFDGGPRVADGDHDGVAAADIGAHENRGEPTRLRFTSASTLAWDGSANPSAVFDLYRDDFALLGGPTVGVCLDPGLAGTTTSDFTAPAVGTGFAYLVGGRDAVAGPLGFESSGTERIAAVACP